MNKFVEIRLNYRTYNTNLFDFIESTKTLKDAFNYHAEVLRDRAKQLEEIGNILTDECLVDVEIQYICIRCPEDIAKKIVNSGLGNYQENFDEECCKSCSCCGEKNES